MAEEKLLNEEIISDEKLDAVAGRLMKFKTTQTDFVNSDIWVAKE